MAITVGTSTATSGNRTTGFTLVIDSGVVANDILILCVTNRGATTDPIVVDDDIGGNLWAKLAGQNANTNGAGTVWWKRATSATASKTITVSGCTNSAAGCVTPFTGASLGATPYAGVVSEANASGDESQAQITTTRAGSMVCLAIFCTSNDTLNPNTQVATSPSVITERAEGVSSGGSDCSATFCAAIKASAGATGTISWQQTDGTGASIAFELLEAVAALAANAGSFTLTGNAATLAAGRKVAADAGAFVLTGSPAALVFGYNLGASAGSFTLTGVDVGMSRTRVLTADAGSFALIGFSAGLLDARSLFANGASFTLAGSPAALNSGREILAEGGSFSMTGAAANLAAARKIDAATASFSLTGAVASLLHGGAVGANSGAFSLNGASASLEAGRRLSADSASFVLTGSAVQLLTGRRLASSPGSLTLTGSGATLIYSGGGASAPAFLAFF